MNTSYLNLDLSTLWATAFSYGFLGSLHCLGMCGPIALTIPLNRENRFLLILENLLYNFGRVTAYLFLGLLAGLLSNVLTATGWQTVFSLISGLFLIFLAFYRHIPLPLWAGNGLQKHMANILKKFFEKKNQIYLFFFGILNGFLPCSFVYGALIGALNSGQLLSGISFMLFFGIGTIPAMFAMANFGSFLQKFFLSKLKFFPQAIMVGLGIILILRSFGLFHH